MIEQGSLRSLLHYNEETGIFIWLKPPKRHPRLLGKEAGTPIPNQNGKQYCHIKINGKKYKRSRLAYLYMTGALPPDCIDHINGNSLDDRWANLRPATITENAWNHHHRAKKSGLPMGVKLLASGTYLARISVNNRQLALGVFKTPQAAHAAYLEAREAHFGQFA